MAQSANRRKRNGGCRMAAPEPIRIIYLLELARRQEWGEINRVITAIDTKRLRELADFLAARVDGDRYGRGYHPWKRAMVDMLQRTRSLIAARDTRDDWPTLETAEI